MAQYKVPQDVEADDKLLGPFSFRQFVYLMVSAGLIAVAVGLFQIMPFLAIVPIPPVIFFLALALPLKKDQPMETYLAALVSFYLKPHKRVWMPGQREVSITIAAPKKVEDSRTRDITGEEATHRLSFLADIVDTEGYAIKGQMREDLVAEAAAPDMFESTHFENLATTIAIDENAKHREVIEEMRATIQKSAIDEANATSGATIQKRFEEAENPADSGASENSEPTPVTASEPANTPEPVNTPAAKAPEPEKEAPLAQMIELANNPDYTVATIAKEANRIKEKEEGEVFISLH